MVKIQVLIFTGLLFFTNTLQASSGPSLDDSLEPTEALKSTAKELKFGYEWIGVANDFELKKVILGQLKKRDEDFEIELGLDDNAYVQIMISDQGPCKLTGYRFGRNGSHTDSSPKMELFKTKTYVRFTSIVDSFTNLLEDGDFSLEYEKGVLYAVDQEGLRLDECYYLEESICRQSGKLRVVKPELSLLKLLGLKILSKAQCGSLLACHHNKE